LEYTGLLFCTIVEVAVSTAYVSKAQSVRARHAAIHIFCPIGMTNNENGSPIIDHHIIASIESRTCPNKGAKKVKMA
jgi:hypothetical protein